MQNTRGREYFSLDNLNELCGIDDNIDFASSLIQNYEKLHLELENADNKNKENADNKNIKAKAQGEEVSSNDRSSDVKTIKRHADCLIHLKKKFDSMVKLKGSLNFNLDKLDKLCSIDDDTAFADYLVKNSNTIHQELRNIEKNSNMVLSQSTETGLNSQSTFVKTIQGHAKYLLYVVKKAGLKSPSTTSPDSSDKWLYAREVLEAIKQKQRDRKLNISVVGEFSTGKSTFINALLRQKLLVSSPIQGTTLASTVIEQGDEYSIEASFLGEGKKEKKLFSDIASMRMHLSELTTNEATAKRLKSVHVTLPTECFCPDIRIIDTPGTNAIEAWHEEVTVRTIKKQSDLSIILITAERMVTNTVIAFVKKNLHPILSQCVFVVTHIDQIEDENDRGMQLDYIRKKIKDELELENPLVLPYASTLVLGTGQSDLPENVKQSLVEESLNNERQLQRHTARMRLIAQVKNLMILINDLYEDVKNHISVFSQKIGERLTLLSQTQKADFQSFIQNQKKKVLEELEKQIEEITDSAEEKVEEESRRMKSELLGNVMNINTLDGLKFHVEKEISPRFADEISNLAQKTGMYSEQMSRKLRSSIEKFYVSFKKEYQQRGLLKLEIPVHTLSIPRINTVNSVDLSSAFNYVVEEVSKENMAIGTGAVAGAVTGGMIAGPFGALAGAFIGCFFGATGAEKLKQVKNKCYEKLSSGMDDSLNKIGWRMRDSVQEYGDSILKMCSSEVDRYYETYKNSINALVNKERQKIKELELVLKKTQSDSELVSERSKRLESVEHRLDELAGGINYEC